MQNLNIFTAFIFGLLAFFSPCTFPLVPSFISFLAGTSVENLQDEVYSKEHRNKIFLSILSYVIGSSFTLVLLGTIAGGAGYFLRSNRYLIQQIGGIIVIIFGLYMLKFIKLPFLSKGFELRGIINKVAKSLKIPRFFQPLLLGVVFTLGWIPCISPILGSILLLASSSSSYVYGGLLLFIYAIGQNFLLLLFGLFIANYLGYFKIIRKNILIFSNLIGVFMIILGFVMLLGGFSWVTSFIYEKAVNIYSYF